MNTKKAADELPFFVSNFQLINYCGLVKSPAFKVLFKAVIREVLSRESILFKKLRVWIPAA